MSDWIEQYSAALSERDAREQAHKPYIDAYTRLAHRTASPPTAPLPSSPEPAPKGKEPRDPLLRLRTDLATTQKARTTLQARVDELTASLTALSTHHTAATAHMTSLARQKADAERKLRDRDEELKGKARLVTEAQDEMVALGLQLNMAEQKTQRLQRENEDLVARWMKRVGEEADRMNSDSHWA
ncbi:autophagy protein 16 [Teratosphaeria nubilosa]|uniref:Autophagy protein 16 n=1 Tax=Teratosphaeria nubilosa TaxID=161662 RepID=A0A6G1LJD4_9PEZI|nr:autophagy protein 16 [Teratosphaeria nubilosa]